MLKFLITVLGTAQGGLALMLGMPSFGPHPGFLGSWMVSIAAYKAIDVGLWAQSNRDAS